MNKKLSEKDKKDWEDFLLKNEKLPNKDLKSPKNFFPKNRHIDLHGYSLEEANMAIEKLINMSYEQGVSKLIVVTGKGIHSDNEKDPYELNNLSVVNNSNNEILNTIVEMI